MATIAGQRVRGGSEPYWEGVDFLVEEATMLDENRNDEWLTTLHPEITYRAPIRLTRERALGREATVSAEGFHLYEDFDSLRTRVERLATEYAWAEDPPSRTRRFLTNFRVWTEGKGVLVVHSSLLLRRYHQDEVRPLVLSAERQDEIARVGGRLLLRRRLILFDHTILDAPSLSVLL